MNDGLLIRIRQAVYEGHYEFTDHLLEEAEADNLTTDDVLYILQTGFINAVYTHETREPRYAVRGKIDVFEVEVICKFRRDGSLLIIITVYVVY